MELLHNLHNHEACNVYLYIVTFSKLVGNSLKMTRW